MLHRHVLATHPAVAAAGLFAATRAMAVVVFGLVPVALVVLAFRLRRRRVAALSIAAAAALILAVAADAFLIEPRWLEVTTRSLPVQGIRRPLRIALLADLQTDRPGPWEARVIKRALEQRPDLVLLGGDLIQLDDGDPATRIGKALDEMAQILRAARVSAPLGAFAVQGNVDRPGLWQRGLKGTGIVPIEQTTRLDLGPIVLTCLSLGDSFDPALALKAEARPHVVLGHAPDFALARPPAELLLAGHTHGGQVRLPGVGPLVTLSRVPRAWASGATWITPSTLLVVSRGVGMERGSAPRLRLGCRPELVLVDLVPRSEPGGPGRHSR